MDAGGPRLATARHWKTRAWLSRRVLLLWKVACEDGTGGPLAWTLVPLVVAVPNDVTIDRVNLNRWLREIDGELRRRVDEATREWRGQLTNIHHAFTQARLSRTCAMGQASDEQDAQLFQTGLFDRRAERAQAVARGGDEEGAAWCAQRAAARCSISRR